MTAFRPRVTVAMLMVIAASLTGCGMQPYGGRGPASGHPIIAAATEDVTLTVDCYSNPETLSVKNNTDTPFFVTEIAGWGQDELRYGPFLRRDRVDGGQAIIYYAGSKAPGGNMTLSRGSIFDQPNNGTFPEPAVVIRGKKGSGRLHLGCAYRPVSASWGFNPIGGMDPYDPDLADQIRQSGGCYCTAPLPTEQSGRRSSTGSQP
jgi:hypothetical protein